LKRPGFKVISYRFMCNRDSTSDLQEMCTSSENQSRSIFKGRQ